MMRSLRLCLIASLVKEKAIEVKDTVADKAEAAKNKASELATDAKVAGSVGKRQTAPVRSNKDTILIAKDAGEKIADKAEAAKEAIVENATWGTSKSIVKPKEPHRTLFVL